MEFSFTDQHIELLGTVRRWGALEFGPLAAADRLAGKPFDVSASWRALAELGWLGIATDPADGGGGGTMVDACIVVEGLAANWCNAPIGGALISAVALSHLELDPTIAGAIGQLVAGERRYSLFVGSDLSWAPGGSTGVGWEAHPGDVIVAIDGNALVPIQGLTSLLPTRDLVRPMMGVDHRTALQPPGPASHSVLAASLAVTSAGLLGTMTAALELAQEHALNRRQFGRQIGSFQAVQHLLADMYVDIESSRSVLYGAAWTLGDSAPDDQLWSAAVAKAWIAPAARRVVENAIQVLGGIGMTWEHPAHLLLRTAHVLGAAFASKDRSLDLVSRRLPIERI